MVYIPPDLYRKVDAQKKMQAKIQSDVKSKAKADIERLKKAALATWDTPAEGEEPQK